MYNVVTIDFDIIMGPSIDLYNHLVPNNPWEKLFSQNPNYQLLMADFENYQMLTNLILNFVPSLSAEDIIICSDHDYVARYIIDINKEVSLVNIDHHHDVTYKLDDDQILNCSNWVKILKDKNLCLNYFWIHNINSIHPAPEQFDKYIDAKSTIKQLNIDTLMSPSKLFLCLSPQWVPPFYHKLFYLWLDLLNRQYNTHFDFSC